MSVSQTCGPSPGRRRLDDDECRDWLARHEEGRLGCRTGRGWRSVLVRYVPAEGELLVQLPDYNDIVRYAPGRPIVFEVSGRQRDGLQETVAVLCEPYVVDSEHIPADRPFDEHWPDDLAVSIIALPTDRLVGSVPT